MASFTILTGAGGAGSNLPYHVLGKTEEELLASEKIGNTTTGKTGDINQSYYSTPSNISNYYTGRPIYSQSQEVTDAKNAVTTQEQAKPADYASNYNNQIQGLIDSILNRKQFSYDASSDPLYRQYADQYTRNARKAQINSTADAAALSGGYGNSYAQLAGNQAYQQTMEGLNDKLSEFYDKAYQRYTDQLQGYRDDLSMLQGQDDTEYGRYRDTVTDWKDLLDYYQNKYQDLRDTEYGRYQEDAQNWEDDRAFWYQQALDDLDYQKWLAEWNDAHGDTGGGGGGGGSTKLTPVTAMLSNQLKAIARAEAAQAKAEAEAAAVEDEKKKNEYLNSSGGGAGKVLKTFK